jgi:two-component system NtrC family response regulator
MPLWHCCGGIFISRLVAGSCPFTYKSSKDMPLVFGKSLYLHTLFFTVISLKTYRIDMSKILIIDDEVQIRTLLTRMMELEGYDVCQAGDCRAALKQLELQNPDVVLCDVFLPDGNGVDLVLAIKKAAPNVEVILLTAHGNIPDGVQAIKNGAFDYITKGDDNNKIIPLISRAVEKARMNVRLEKLEKKVGQTYSFDSILGESKVLKDAVSLAQKVSGTDVPVLLTGETGTGKEVFAQAIHYSSKRARQNFVAVNCSSFSKELLESEMFGHKAGSFTGALKDKKGLFEEANNGTIFLDEIGEMAFELQAKLLRILETGEYIKIGDTKPTRVNVRIIAATNRNLSQEIVAGRFREDLFYRLSVFQIHLPPLRERAGDIRLLAKAFIKSFAEQLARPVVEIAPAFLEALDSQPWKGNIRELRNVIERSMIVCESGYLDIADLPFDIQNAHYEHSNDSSPGSFELSAMERRHIARVLEYTKGNKTEAARLLKIGLTTLYRKIEEYKISERLL